MSVCLSTYCRWGWKLSKLWHACGSWWRWDLETCSQLTPLATKKQESTLESCWEYYTMFWNPTLKQNVLKQMNLPYMELYRWTNNMIRIIASDRQWFSRVLDKALPQNMVLENLLLGFWGLNSWPSAWKSDALPLSYIALLHTQPQLSMHNLFYRSAYSDCWACTYSL